jgi:hypothetical protein
LTGPATNRKEVRSTNNTINTDSKATTCTLEGWGGGAPWSCTVSDLHEVPGRGGAQTSGQHTHALRLDDLLEVWAKRIMHSVGCALLDTRERAAPAPLQGLGAKSQMQPERIHTAYTASPVTYMVPSGPTVGGTVMDRCAFMVHASVAVLVRTAYK